MDEVGFELWAKQAYFPYITWPSNERKKLIVGLLDKEQLDKGKMDLQKRLGFLEKFYIAVEMHSLTPEGIWSRAKGTMMKKL